MKKIRCIIIEDEPLASEKLANFIAKVTYLELVESFSNSTEGLTYLQNHHIDLLFLDIQMEVLTGIELLEVLSQKPSIIITSAYQEYALRGYEFQVSDYLLKPYSYTRFLQAIDKIQTQTKELPPSEPDFIFVKTEHRIEKVSLDDILYIEGMSDYLRVHTKHTKIMCLQKFSAFEEMLPKDRFVRVHKSFLVATNQIESIERQRIKIRDQLIPISHTYKEVFFNLLEKKGML